MADFTCKWEYIRTKISSEETSVAKELLLSNSTALILTQPKISASKIMAVYGPLY